MLYILITSKIWLLFSIGLRFQTLWRHFSKFSYLELYLKVFIIKIQIISHPECHAKSALINYHVKNPLFIQKWNKPTSANKSELWRHPDFSSLNNFEWAKFDRNSCHTCIVSFFTFYFIYVHGDLDPRPVLHERHLRGRGERRRHERGHEQGVHQRGEVKKIISNNVYQAEIFILDFNNALCLNFGFSYFLSFCAGSFFMVITLIFKLNNCVICTQAKMGFIWQFLYIPVIIHPLNFTKGHGGKGSIIYFFEGIPKQWFLIMYKVLFRNWTFSWWIFSIKA